MIFDLMVAVVTVQSLTPAVYAVARAVVEVIRANPVDTGQRRMVVEKRERSLIVVESSSQRQGMVQRGVDRVSLEFWAALSWQTWATMRRFVGERWVVRATRILQYNYHHSVDSRSALGSGMHSRHVERRELGVGDDKKDRVPGVSPCNASQEQPLLNLIVTL